MTTEPGYLNRRYALSLSDHGRLRYLPQCGAWILVREIPGTGYYDGIGLYPLFCCKDWGKLPDDLETLRGELVSLTLVADPLGDYSVFDLLAWFEHVRPFKPHFVLDYQYPVERPDNHKRNIEKAARKGITAHRISRGIGMANFYPQWCQQYALLIERHEIGGFAAFSPEAFSYQMTTPGIIAFVAMLGMIGGVAGALFYEIEGRAYYHLGASTDAGYEYGAMFAIFDAAIDYFRSRVAFLDFGGGAGLDHDDQDGLVRFKRGWTNDVRPAYLCGQVLDRRVYEELTAGVDDWDFFPAYRRVEGG